MDPQCLGAKVLDKSKFLRMKKLEDFSSDDILKFLVSENISHDSDKRRRIVFLGGTQEYFK